MDKINQWLASLGLAEYLPSFAANHIDFEVLRDLSDEDLKDVGIASLGHRRKLLRAIAELPARVQDWQPPKSSIAAEPMAHPGEISREVGRPIGRPSALIERRNLSVMFFDLVGFEALAARLDCEELDEIVRLFQAETARIVGVYDGFATRCSNDRVMAYFGYPRAHEDDAERAVRAGLDLLGAVAKRTSPAPLALRISVATGLVVVGDAQDDPSPGESSLTGDAPNLAARLQELADPNSIVVSVSTRRLLGELFELRDLGLHEVKGVADPVRAFAVVRARSYKSRFEAHSANATALVGRRDEREHLLARRRLAWQGRGQAVLISGESGIGKSRLSAWLASESSGQAHIALRCQCTPHHRNTTLYPVVNQMERTARFSADDTPPQKLEKLERALSLGGLDPAAAVPLFAALMLLPTGGRYPPAPANAQKLRQRTIETVLEQVEGLAKRRPVMFFCEDAQWADPASLEVLDLMIDRIARLPVLAVITARPEFRPSWEGRHNVSVVALQRLDRRQARAMVDGVTTGAQLPVEVLEQILVKTDGIPLFIEELTKMVLESGLLVAADHEFRLTGPLPPLAIPATLQDSLMARLDRFDEVREVAQVGAAIGREFSYKVLERVTGTNGAALQDALVKLEQAQLASRRGIPPDATYTFKHALVQDAAYESLLKSRRQAIHRRIAETLRDEFPVLAETEPETVARHFTLALRAETAIEWWTRAGELALRKSANGDAIAHFDSAIALTDGLPADPARNLARFRLQVAYANAQLALHGYTGQPTVEAFKRCIELGGNIQDVIERFAGFYGIWAASFASGEAMHARQLIESFLEGVGPLTTARETAVGRRMRGLARWCTGDYAGAVADLEAVLAAYDPKRDLALTFRFGQDLGLSTMIKLAVAAWPMGRVDFARGLMERALARARELGHMQTLAYVCCYKGCLEAVRDAPMQAGPDALATLNIGRNYDLNIFWVGIATVLRGWTRWRAGERDPGASEMQEGFVVLRDHGIGLYQPLCDALWAEVQGAQDCDAGVRVLDAALDATKLSKQVWFDAELHRRRGTLLVKGAQAQAAEASLKRAIDIAQGQRTRTFEMRAALDLARLYSGTGRAGEVTAILQPIVRAFDDTNELPELFEARQLLELGNGVEVGCSA